MAWAIGLNCARATCSSIRCPPGRMSILLSNVLHDWDVGECQALFGRCAAALSAGGRLLIHDVYLNDAPRRPPADRPVFRIAFLIYPRPGL